MVLNVTISSETESKLRAKAAAEGVDVATYAARQLELLAAASRSLREISGPIGEAFAHSGASEDELSDFLEAEKHDLRRQRREQAAG